MKQGIIIIGAGGHAKVCIELLRAMGESIDYCIGADSSLQCLGVPVLQGDANLARLRDAGYSKIFIAIGANNLRVQLANIAGELGYQLVNAMSPQAIISPTVQLGVGIAVMAGAVINAETVIGDLAIINTGATVDHDCQIGKACHIAPQCGLAGNVSIGERSFLGIGCKVIPNISIGVNVMIGAGSVVVSDIEQDLTAMGIPARATTRPLKVEK